MRYPAFVRGMGGQPTIEIKGYGTERIEEDVQEYFPGYEAARMDLDTTRSRNSYEQIISDFEQQKTRILVGTQMVTKGLDFDHVSVVGILNADTMMNYPDFRAHERAYQMMAQVAGRAGRKNHRGTVVLQTSEPNHPLIRRSWIMIMRGCIKHSCRSGSNFLILLSFG